ncbi:MAG: hypothetical protein GXZ01_05335 [Clostridiaceae bacterium]|jgi:F0F1-type ATP synthase membrane subunit b/b'|nr:hypothetical protein [Clostridiaceae bacterium]
MAISLLKDIISVEQMVEKKEQETLAKAREIIASAKKEASALLAEKEKAAELEAAEIIKARQNKAMADIEEYRLKIEEECRNIREKSGTRIEQAADFIVGRIVKHSDR